MNPLDTQSANLTLLEDIKWIYQNKMDLSNLPDNLKTITLNEHTNYRLSKIGKIKDYFECEIKYQELSTRRLSKCFTCFDYPDKILTAFLLFLVEQVKTKKRLLGLITSIFL